MAKPDTAKLGMAKPEVHKSLYFCLRPLPPSLPPELASRWLAKWLFRLLAGSLVFLLSSRSGAKPKGTPRDAVVVGCGPTWGEGSREGGVVHLRSALLQGVQSCAYVERLLADTLRKEGSESYVCSRAAVPFLKNILRA